MEKTEQKEKKETKSAKEELYDLLYALPKKEGAAQGQTAHSNLTLNTDSFRIDELGNTSEEDLTALFGKMEPISEDEHALDEEIPLDISQIMETLDDIPAITPDDDIFGESESEIEEDSLPVGGPEVIAPSEETAAVEEVCCEESSEPSEAETAEIVAEETALETVEPAETEAKENEPSEAEAAASESEVPKPEEAPTAEESVAEDLSGAPDMPTDTAMMKAFGLEPKTEDTVSAEKTSEDLNFMATAATRIAKEEPKETKEEPKANERKASNSAKKGTEYVSPAQNKAIFESLRAKYNSAKLRLILSAILMVALALIENIPAMEDILGGRTNLILVDVFLMICAAVLVIDRLIAAVRSLLKFEFYCDSVTLFALILSLIATTAALLLSSKGDVIDLYNFPFAFCVFLNMLNLFISIHHDVYAFQVISCDGTKYVLSNVFAEQAPLQEQAAFAEYLEKNETVCAVKKADFISSFFAHRHEKADSNFLLKIFVPECLIFSVLFFLVSYFVLENSLGQSIGTAYASFLMSAPFTAFLAYSYPVYLATKRAYGYRSTIIGDKTHENYARTSVIALRDEEAFPAALTKVKGMKLYGERNIEKTLYYASSLYDKLGGPMAGVFKRATVGTVTSEDVEIREITYNGVSAMVDGRRVVVGTPAYMNEQCFGVMQDPGDENFVGNHNIRVLYIAYDEVIAAKFYIEYTTTKGFVKMARRLAEAGVAISLRTADPCLDDGILLYNHINTAALTSVKTVNGVLPAKTAKKHSAKFGGIVSAGAVKDIIKTFLLCEKITNVKRINFVLKTVAAILGIAIMVLVLFTGNADKLLSIFPVLYQLFWIVPVFIISKIYI